MTVPQAPVRRSALERVHAGLGTGWPMTYGDLVAERLAIAETVGLAEPGLYDKWLLRGPGTLAALRAAGLDATPGFVTAATIGRINVWTIAPDEVWLIAYAPTPGGPPASPIDFSAALTAARQGGVQVTDLSSGWAVLRLFGPGVRDLLEELVAIDLSPAAIPDLAIAQVTIAGSRVILSRRDSEGVPGFTMLVGRDEAVHLWDVFSHVGEAHGIRPVGGSALVPASQSAPSAPATPIGADAT